MRAHAISTKASTIVSGGILALGLAVVLLAATASTASAAFFVDPAIRGRASGEAELRLRRPAGRNDEPGAAL